MYPDEIPDTLVLHQNYPNPFNPVTVIEYELKQNIPVTLRVFDVAGRLVRTLVDQHKAQWETHRSVSRRLASGRNISLRVTRRASGHLTKDGFTAVRVTPGNKSCGCEPQI